ncbi:MAG: NAD-binding protein [Luteolibacter sp.]|uniref:NAD(P)/FAD-dependent oxidoreductase n=1 Tax=Luteolibacter sp. TaxID=1962973 RepID=UPI003266EEF4
MNREITITGGGLSGLALASALRSHEVPVTVLEAGRYPRHRVCGEFISGVSDSTLAALGIRRLFDDALRHRSLSWLENGRMIHSDRLKSPALGISRHLLDERLLRHVESLGGIVRCGIRGNPVPGEGRVWTAGRKPENGPWIGLKAHVRGIEKSADLEMHSGTNGYAGLAGVEDGWTNVCGLFRMDRAIKAAPGDLLTTYLEAGGNSKLAARLRDCEWREGSVCAVAGFKPGRQIPMPGLLALGDAVSMIPPFTGNGMSMAFQSAELAVEPLVAWSQGEKSWQDAVNEVRTRMDRKFKRRLTVAGALHSILLDQSGRNLVSGLASAKLLPFQSMLATVR